MRSVIAIATALSLLQLASAQPHRRHDHNAAHVKKDVVTLVNTVIAEESAAPLVVVVVDASGIPVSTTTQDAVATPISTQSASSSITTSSATLNTTSSATSLSTSSAASSSVFPTVQAAVFEAAPSPSSVIEVPTTSSIPISAPTTSSAFVIAGSSSSSASAASSSSTPSTGSGDGYGFTYGPYYSDGACKDASAVLEDLKAASSGYSLIRTYGTDCNTVENVLAACKELNLLLFAGVFDLNSLSSELDLIISAANGDWSHFYGVAIGNELVNSGTADVGTVTSAISTARSTLRSANFEGPVGTVDTLVATRSNPDLCNESDVCWMNSHPFFDGYTLPDAAGTFLTTQIATVKSVLSNSSQKIVITETGWPSQGSNNNQAIPSSENQATAVSAIKSAFESDPSGVILFNIYNMMWKTSSAAQYDAEQWWGFLGDAPSG